MNVFAQITRPRYSSPYSWPLSSFLAIQKQWEVRRKMNAIGWGGKTLEQVRNHFSLGDFPGMLLPMWFYSHRNDIISWFSMLQVYEDVSQCCQALSQRLGTQPFFFNKQYVSVVSVSPGVQDIFKLILIHCNLFTTATEQSDLIYCVCLYHHLVANVWHYRTKRENYQLYQFISFD